jgi:hypothetical protein
MAMPRLPFLAALLAAIMLVIGGGPARAASEGCDPCPPDCPMMAQMATATADHHGAPAKGDKADDPCKPGPLCQTTAAAIAAPALSGAPVYLATVGDALRPLRQLPATSRPPDRSLRPPIQL